MTAPSTSAPSLSTEQVAHVLRLLQGADSVELKLSVPDADRRSTVAALGMDALDAEMRQVVFFDTPELMLDQHGVVVRARRRQRRTGDSIVKLRPLVPEQLPPALRRSRAVGVEVDAMPGGFVCSGSMKAQQGARVLRERARRRQLMVDLAIAPAPADRDANANARSTLEAESDN